MTKNNRDKLLDIVDNNPKGEAVIDFGGTTVTGIAAVAYEDLVDYLGMDVEVKVFDMMHQMAIIDDSIKERYHSAAEILMRPRPRFGIPIYEGWKKGRLSDGTECLIPKGFSPIKEEGSWYIRQEGNDVAKRSEKSEWFDPIYHPLKGKNDIADLKSFNLRHYTREDREYLERESERLHDNTNRGVVATISKDAQSSLMESAQLLRGYDIFFMDLGRKPKYVNYLLDKIVDNFKRNFDSLYEAVGDNADLLKLSDDYGGQDDLLISPNHFRKYFKPRLKEMIRYVKDKSNYRIFFHSDGAIREIIPDLIDIGVDVLNPIQTSCRGMDPDPLEKEFGSDIVFWGGGLDIQDYLPRGNTDDIITQIEERLDIFTTNGGYVFATIHNVPPGTPPKTVEAIFRTANEFIGN